MTEAEQLAEDVRALEVVAEGWHRGDPIYGDRVYADRLRRILSSLKEHERFRSALESIRDDTRLPGISWYGFARGLQEVARVALSPNIGSGEHEST